MGKGRELAAVAVMGTLMAMGFLGVVLDPPEPRAGRSRGFDAALAQSSTPSRARRTTRARDPLDGGGQALEGASAVTPFTPPTATQPQGVYAKVDILSYIEQDGGPSYNAGDGSGETVFTDLYTQLLGNPAIAGLAISVHWDWGEPRNRFVTSTPYNWNYIDDAFHAAHTWNTANPAATPKNVQLILSVGFEAPTLLWDANAGGPWVGASDSGPIPFCDGLFQGGTAPGDCGVVTFAGFSEAPIDPDNQFGVEASTLPVPWDPAYVAGIEDWVNKISGRYGPGTGIGGDMLVSVTIVGPNAASAEMILPDFGNSGWQSQFETTGGSADPLTPEQMWNSIIAQKYGASSTYQNTDEAFIEAWKNMTVFFQSAFQGVTLVLVPGNGDGLPSFGSVVVGDLHGTENYLQDAECAFSTDGGHFPTGISPSRSCEAISDIVSAFSLDAGPNGCGMAVQIAGLTARTPLDLGPPTTSGTTGDWGVAGCKYLAALTQGLAWPSRQVVAGAQLNHAVTLDPANVGCVGGPCGHSKTLCDLGGGTCAAISPEQALYNVMQVGLKNTAASVFGGVTSTQPLNFIQVGYQDVLAANADPCDTVLITDPLSGYTFDASLQDLLNLMQAALIGVGEPSSCPGTVLFDACTGTSNASCFGGGPGKTCHYVGSTAICPDNTLCVQGCCLPLWAAEAGICP